MTGVRNVTSENPVVEIGVFDGGVYDPNVLTAALRRIDEILAGRERGGRGFDFRFLRVGFEES